MTKLRKKMVLLAVLGLGLLLLLTLDMQGLTRAEALREWAGREPVLAWLLYGVVFFLVAVLSLPGTGALTIVAGALFGLLWGVVLVSFVSAVAATLNMLVCRLLLRDWLERRFGHRFQRISEGIDREGSFYLVSLRLIPIMPYFLVNPLFGLSHMRARQFFLLTQVGMLPGVVVYANAGRALGALESVDVYSVLSPELLFSLTILALFPWLIRAIVPRIRRRLPGRT